MNDLVWFAEDEEAASFRFPNPRLASAVGEDDAQPGAIVFSGDVDPSRILIDRPDVLANYYKDFYSALNDRHSDAWVKRVGGGTPEDYARFWYDTHGRAEGYDPSRVSLVSERAEAIRQLSGHDDGPVKITFDGLQLDYILANRPDVLRAYYEGYYGPGNDRHSTAWVDRVGGDTPEAYANYWYEKYGRWEGYGKGQSAASEPIDIERLLQDRPDVFRAFYEQYFGKGNDRKSSAWVDRVGGDTVQDYAKYWYVTYGQREGYTQRPPAEPDPAPSPFPEEPDVEPTPSEGEPETDELLVWTPPPPTDADFFG